MSVATKLKRYMLIIDKIQQSKFPSLSEIEQLLKRSDVLISERTLQRDIEQIRLDCEISILYDYQQKGYYIEENELSKNRIHFLQHQTMSSDFLNFIKQHPKNTDAILLSNDIQMKGYEYIEPILFAISNNREIEFTYQKFSAATPKSFTIQAYALKEFQQRWYLVGVLKGLDSISKFGLDRIQSLRVSTKKFTKQKNIQVKEHFANMLGIDSQSETREIVQLAFTPFQAKYIETLPLHWSQEKIKENDDEVIFEYYLLPNYELIQKILSYGNQVRVVQPKFLVKEIRKILKDAYKQY